MDPSIAASSDPLANFAGRLAAAAANADAYTTVASLVFAAKQNAPRGLLVGVVIAISITALALCLSLFDCARSLYRISAEGKRLRQEEEGEQLRWSRWFASWRWIYSLLLALASILQIICLVLYLQSTAQGNVARQPSKILGWIAFSFYSVAAATVLLAFASAARPAHAMGEQNSRKRKAIDGRCSLARAE